MEMQLKVLAALFEGDWYNSPYIVPVAGCAMIGSIAVAGIWSGVRNREIRSHERLARIAQGLPVEPDVDDAVAAAMAQVNAGRPASGIQRPNDGGGARRAGVVLVSVGLGLLAFFFVLAVLVHTSEVMAGGAAGLIPLAIGIGFLVDARAKRREYAQYLEWERSMAMSGMYAGQAAGAAPGAVPPPPPPGMSAAQASDWRPLH